MGEGISGDKMNAGDRRKRGDGRVKRDRGVGGEGKQTDFSRNVMIFAITAHVYMCE